MKRALRLALRKLPFVQSILSGLRSRSRERLLGMLPKNSMGAEIGVWKGDFSAKILRTVRPKELHLVDPWAFQPQYPGRLYGGKAATQQAAMDAIYHTVCARFAGNQAVKIHRRFSRDLKDIVPAQSLDWIYIDGDHSKAAVKLDLLLALDIVKSGGVIAGDDYHWRDSDGSLPVKNAVTEVVSERDLTLIVTGGQFIITRP